METAKQVGARLQKRRLKAKKPSYAALAKRIYLDSGGLVNVSDQTIANYHAGKIEPSAMTLETMEWLAKLYGCKLEELSEVCARRSALILRFAHPLEMGRSQQVDEFVKRAA